jgi:ATP-dependent RNA helicase RhlE
MRHLADVEKLLKRSITRVTAEGFDSADRGEARRRDEREPRRHRDEREGRRPRAHTERGGTERDYREHRFARSTLPPRNTVDASGFDFSKPYEPSPESAPKEPSAPLPLRGHARRPTAALLGGTPHKDKK